MLMRVDSNDNKNLKDFIICATFGNLNKNWIEPQLVNDWLKTKYICG